MKLGLCRWKEWKGSGGQGEGEIAKGGGDGNRMGLVSTSPSALSSPSYFQTSFSPGLVLSLGSVESFEKGSAVARF